MQTIPLADTNRQTTRLGFGCGNLMGAMNRRDSLKLLETAYDAGIRHFDVAPRYGYGEAESCLGDFLEHHRGQVTVTTKYGIFPAKKTSLITLGRQIAGPIIRKIPTLKRSLARAAKAATQNPERPTFTAAQAKASLDRSLLALRTDHIDLWLLHEVTAADLQDDSLLQLLETEVKNTSAVEESSCRRIKIIILGKDGAIIIPLSTTGCISAIDLWTGDKWLRGTENDLGGFGCSYSDFEKLRCTVSNQRVRIDHNNSQVYEGPQQSPVGDIVGLRIVFEGSGVIGSVKFSGSAHVAYDKSFILK